MKLFNALGGSRKFRRGGPGNFFFSHQRISQRTVRASPENQLHSRVQNASRAGGGGKGVWVAYQYFIGNL